MRIISFLACFLLLGCGSATVSENIAQTAKESISIAYRSLPKECKTKDNEMLYINAQKQVDHVVESCKLEMQKLEERLRYKNLLIFGLSGFVCILVLLILRQALGKISLPTLGSLLGHNNRNSENQSNI